MSHLEIISVKLEGKGGTAANQLRKMDQFRSAAVEKFHSRGSRSVEEVAQILGVSS